MATNTARKPQPPTDRLSVEVAPDHLESLTRLNSPLTAIEELVWNALDADATTVEVTISLNRMSGIQEITVSDNGHGIHKDKWHDAFGTLGGSPKLTASSTPGGRKPHGKSGRGRFRAFGLGELVRWRSRYRANGQCLQFDIVGRRTTIRDFDASEPTPVRAKPGVAVQIANIQRQFPSLLDQNAATQELSRRLALYLRQYPGIDIKYDGKTVNPKALEDYVATYPLSVSTPESRSTVAGELTVIEWKVNTERALYLCDSDGFARDELAPGIQAKGFQFTAYLKSDLIAELEASNTLAIGGLSPPLQALIDAAKSALKQHFRKRESQRSADLVRQWQEEEIYPYTKTPTNPIEVAEREVFDVCAIKVYEYSPGFDDTDKKGKQLTFRLIREALESNPTSLQAILREVLALPQEQQNELASLLERTKLGSLINASKIVISRLDFLASLESLLFGEFKKTLTEPSQLHRILADELWLFGEQYSIGIDEESLKNLLKAHVSILGRNDLVEASGEVKDLDGNDRRLDLMMYRRYPQLVQNTFEHLVVELKRPSLKLGKDEISQIEDYAFKVADDDRFDKRRTRWTFVLLGTGLDRFAENKCNVKDRQFGHIHSGDVNIHIKTWSTVTDEAKWRYNFFREKLECEVTTDDGVAYLRKKHAERIPQEGKQSGTK